jgi:hypothetical protein
MRLSMNDEGIRGQMHRFGGLSKKPHFPDHVLRHVTPLTSLQEDILALLGLSPDIYRTLARNSP